MCGPKRTGPPPTPEYDTVCACVCVWTYGQWSRKLLEPDVAVCGLYACFSRELYRCQHKWITESMTFLKITLHTSCLSGLWLIYFYNIIFLHLTHLLCYFCTDSQTATAASLKLDRNSVGLTGLISIYGSLLKSVGHAYYYARALPDHLCTVITPFDTCTVTSVKWKVFTIILYLFFWILLKIHISVHVKWFVIKERSESVL